MTLPHRPPVRVVLDRSAMLSYARGHIHVGEAISEISEDHEGRIGLPVVAFLQAHVQVAADKDSRLLLRHLATLPSVSVLPIERRSVEGVAEVAGHTGGDLGGAHAAWAAVELDALCLTAEPESLASVLQPEAIIAVPSEDA